MKHLFLLLFTTSIFAQVTLFKKQDKDALTALITASATTQTTINAKEDTSNKTNLQTDATSTIKFPTFGAVNNFVTPLLAGKLPTNAINGTLNFVPKFASANTIGNSQIVDTGTNVGIGTLTPSAKFQVNGTIKAEANNAVSSQGAHLSWNRNNGDGATWLINQNGDGTGGIVFGQSTTANVFTEFARFNGTGQFGIGTITPTNKLHISNFGFNPATNDLAALKVSGSFGGGVVFSEGTNRCAIWSPNGNSLFFGTGGLSTGTPTRMAILSTGNVGIGTTFPNSKLHISGSVAELITNVPSSLTLNENHNIMLLNNGGTTITVTLPDASTCIGRKYEFSRSPNSTGAVTIAVVAGQVQQLNGAMAATTTIDTHSATGAGLGIKLVASTQGWIRF